MTRYPYRLSAEAVEEVASAKHPWTMEPMSTEGGGCWVIELVVMKNSHVVGSPIYHGDHERVGRTSRDRHAADHTSYAFRAPNACHPWLPCTPTSMTARAAAKLETSQSLGRRRIAEPPVVISVRTAAVLVLKTVKVIMTMMSLL